MNNTLKKILLFLCGVALIIFGIVVLANWSLMIYFCAIALIIYGGGSLLMWFDHKKSGTASRWSFWIAIASIASGVAIIVGGSLDLVTVGFVMLVFGIWLIVCGVLEIIGAVIYRKAMTTIELGVQAPGSMLSIVFGGIMIGVGLLVALLPIFALVVATILLAIAMIVGGVRMIFGSFSTGSITKKEEIA